MKPVDYSKTSRYGDVMAAYRVQNIHSPLKNKAPVEMEAAFYEHGMNQALQLGYMGLQKEQFEAGMAEDKRQFDVSMSSRKKEFRANINMARDQMKYQRRQDNRAEIVGMVNVGIGIGFGYLQYKQNRQQILMNKMMMGIMQGRS